MVLVTHDASLTGAPMVALLVARSLAEQGDEVTVVSRRSGPLLADFAAVAPTVPELLYRVRRRLWESRVLRPVAWIVDVLAATATLARHRADLVYVNSTAASIYVHAARWLKVPVVLHVHESDANTDMFLSQARVDDLEGVELVACSPQVERDLMARTGRPSGGVHLLLSVPDADRLRAMACEDGGAPPAGDPLMVGATGSVGHRKGTDLWLQVARIVQASHPAHFVWVGELGDPAMAVPTPGVDFTGPTSNPYPAMAWFDIATLPSRDDPFPLVVVESMLLGKPVVAFDVGSVRDQVGEGGILVPPEDVEAFAAAVLHLLTDESARAALGVAARERAERLFSSTAFTHRLREILGAPTGPTGQEPRIAARQAR
ncbi:hypothetical protein C7S10_00885 [Nocardioides currus]|uniref:Glycosyltransferase subfamily 4-like N-terminal domain-containing protein n=1 Tax=Nocardioides currus TaxID=2133958 RepID=A0A2R7Z131_9ACTN|nr:hypothetical protein C7S10_00885 [Nocardioides currus]